MKTFAIRYKHLVLLVLVFLFISSCNDNTTSFTAKERSLVQDSVQLMTDSIAKAVSHDGPVAWLRYFEDTPGFFMASDGQLEFPNIDTAKHFINAVLVNKIPKIELQWKEVRIEPLTNNLANIAAFYHEDIADSSGKKMPYDGYFTAIAHQTSQGWKLHNAHWSSRVGH